MQIYQDNIFTKIIRKDVPSKIVFESDTLICIHDINPRAKVHVLLITKKNTIDFSDFINQSTNLEIAEFFKTANFIAVDILKLTDYKILSNNGKDAGQEILHFHLHILGYKSKETLN